ncbi:hypothetical protein FRC11_011716, partial [Ceratobasidium sp. 423]
SKNHDPASSPTPFAPYFHWVNKPTSRKTKVTKGDLTANIQGLQGEGGAESRQPA